MTLTRSRPGEAPAGGLVLAVLLAVQPLLDVGSYFMKETGHTAVTTVLRLGMLAAVCVFALILSRRKGLVLLCWGAAGAFWLLHGLNALRVGYADPLGDAAEYLKLLQFPLWTVAFLTLFHRSRDLADRILAVLVLDLALILAVIGLSYLTGRPVYTYEYPERGLTIGVLGWFGVPNAQSALLCLVVPGAMLWALEKARLWLFSLISLAGCALLFFTGTRLAFYAGVLWAAVFLVVVFLCRKPWYFGAPLLVILALFLVFRGASPMAARQAVTGDSFAVYEERVEAVVGEDLTAFSRSELTPEKKAVVARVYQEVYGARGVYHEVLLEDLLERFGVEKVMQAMDYTVSPSRLNDLRARKLTALSLVWEEQDFLTHLLGMEYAKATVGPRNYDPENDFPALVYYYGWLGAALYAAFLLLIAGATLRAFFKTFPRLLTPPVLIFALMLAVGLGAAQLGGQVLRRPNVTVYLSLAGAQLLLRAGRARGRGNDTEQGGDLP